MRRLRRLLALPPAERRVLLDALRVVVFVRLALWLLPFPRVLRLREGLAARPGADRAGLPVEPIVWAVAAASGAVPRATCLVRAIAAQAMLARHGHGSELRLGVAGGAGRPFEAHAWLEQDGRVLIGGPVDPRYVALPPIEARA